MKKWGNSSILCCDLFTYMCWIDFNEDWTEHCPIVSLTIIFDEIGKKEVLNYFVL